MARLAIIGYGRMGKIIEEIARRRGHEVVVIVDPNQQGCKPSINADDFIDIDACIDFSHPGVAISNAQQLADLRVNVVMATTGWYDLMDDMKSVVKSSGIG